ncbi:hypothetical protein ACET3X_009636 [Alternaria dauci]|uniref:F-box domain-containing protein n=1 Tax=Alternaria dauci TaxID=48095 RepID=A0ABR3U7D8_9PLEO
MASDAPSCPLLRLPIELRYEIYDHLCRWDFKSYPFRTMPIASIDRTGPPTALLATCRFLCDEIRAYFLATVTLGFVQQQIPCFQSIDPLSLSAVERAKKIHVRMSWWLIPSAATESRRWPYRVNGWLADLVKLLLENAKSLEVITLSFDEPDCGTEWEQKEKTLAPLKDMAGRVELRLGEVEAGEEVTNEDEAEAANLKGLHSTSTKVIGKEAELKRRLWAYLEVLNVVALPAVSS